MFIDVVTNIAALSLETRLFLFPFFFFFVAGVGIRWDDNMYLGVRSRKVSPVS